MIEQWIAEIKKNCGPDELGMILVHNGVVRRTSKKGKPVTGMRLSYDRDMLASAVEACRAKEGIADVKAWINEGQLSVGDDIMNVCVAGRFRTDVLPALQELLSKIKQEIVHEEEVPA